MLYQLRGNQVNINSEETNQHTYIESNYEQIGNKFYDWPAIKGVENIKNDRQLYYYYYLTVY